MHFSDAASILNGPEHFPLAVFMPLVMSAMTAPVSIPAILAHPSVRFLHLVLNLDFPSTGSGSFDSAFSRTWIPVNRASFRLVCFQRRHSYHSWIEHLRPDFLSFYNCITL
jgi:hypothetical protein